MAKLLDGKITARNVRRELKARIAEKVEAIGRPPFLAVVLVGDDPASQVYVAKKEKFAGRVGMETTTHTLPATSTQEEVEALVRSLGADSGVDGILVQLPLPGDLDSDRVVRCIPPEKDADGLNVVNLAELAVGNECLVPCTPKGVIRLLDEAGFPFEGAEVLVIGRSRLVGKPMAYLLTNRNATVTLAHSRTRNLADLARKADLVVAAVGRKRMVTGDWIQEGAWVIDVGIHREEDGSLCGDVDFDSVEPRASHLTPVPGGVGPMTISMLLENTVDAWERLHR